MVGAVLVVGLVAGLVMATSVSCGLLVLMMGVFLIRRMKRERWQPPSVRSPLEQGPQLDRVDRGLSATKARMARSGHVAQSARTVDRVFIDARQRMNQRAARYLTEEEWTG
jgi:hypothetical protein